MKKIWAFVLAVTLLAVACGGRSGETSATGSKGDSAVSEQSGTDKTDKYETTEKKTGKSKSKDRGPDGTGEGSAETGSAEPAAQSNTSSSNKPGPVAASPLSAGTYRYDTKGTMTISGGRRDMSPVTTLVANAPRGNEQLRTRDLRDSEGNRSVTETILVFKPEGVYLAYVKVTTSFPGGLTDVREFTLNPPELIAPTDARPGFSRFFTMRGSGTRADVTIKALRAEKLTIDGTAVSTIVVDTKIVFSGAIEGRQDSTSWIWPKHLVALKEQVTTDVTNGPISARTEYEAVLQKLEP